MADHPRIRGEHVPVSVTPVSRCGSSPHTRGAPACAISARRRSRIIPAYAGSTVEELRQSEGFGDHPRIRGEHNTSRRADARRSGSSPHTRGAQTDGHRRATAGRIIPAYAGSTRIRPSRARKTSDHPRIRGEHSSTMTRTRSSCGSSPHTRGAPSAILG